MHATNIFLICILDFSCDRDFLFNAMLTKSERSCYEPGKGALGSNLAENGRANVSANAADP